MLGHLVRIRNPLGGDYIMRVVATRNNGTLALAFGNGHLIVEPREVAFVSRHSATVAYTRNYRAAERVRDWLATHGLGRDRTAWIYEKRWFVVVCNDHDDMIGASLLRDMDVDPETGEIVTRLDDWHIAPRRRRRIVH